MIYGGERHLERRVAAVGAWSKGGHVFKGMGTCKGMGLTGSGSALTLDRDPAYCVPEP
jgi:hypothetical protein